MLFAGFNYLPQFKISQIPIFQALLVITILFSFIYKNKQEIPSINAIIFYKLYLYAVIPSFLIGVFNNGTDSIFVFVYTITPFLLFKYTYLLIEKKDYEKLLIALSISMFLIVLIGWLLRLMIIPTDTFFKVMSGEFSIGYWGISYQGSTRNHDYLYPLVGLATSSYFFVSAKKKILNLLLICFFLITMIASLSRGAIVISAVSVILLYHHSSKIKKLIFVAILLCVILFNLSTIKASYNLTYKAIISSIFETKNKDTRFSNAGRLAIISDAIEASVINPIGYGINNYRAIYPKKSVKPSFSAENAYLTILVERGWVAFIFFISMSVSLFKYNFKANSIGLTHFLFPFLFLYFLFNYELNNSFACFIFYILFIDINLLKKSDICQVLIQ